MLTIEQLAAFFAVDENLPTTFSDYDGTVFADGSRWAICTNWARYVRRLIGQRARIVGFDDKINPDSKVALDFYGHDFALIDDRWIVDGWIMHVGGYLETPVLDLRDPAQAETIARLYGKRERWEPLDIVEQEIDAESPEARERALEGIRLPKPEAVAA